MKIIGSLTEERIKEELSCSAHCISNDVVILAFLEGLFCSVSSAYVLSHTPDQGEDFYLILVNGSFVVGFEQSRIVEGAKPENLVVYEVDQYCKALRGRHAHLKLAVAMELATKK